MGVFTLNQATASILEAAEKNYVNGSFGHWTFRVSGSDGNLHYWVDHDTAENANTASIKDAVLAYMTSSVDFYVEPVPPVISASFNSSVVGLLLVGEE
tara:strand:- start:37 stop:330 length:294 start_codon:yes stop_codon:yes gene_type:complete